MNSNNDIMVLLMSMLLFTSVAAAQPPPTELKLWWGIPSRPASNAAEAAAVANVDQFLAENPWISLKSGSRLSLQRYSSGTREFLMAMAGGIAPDVIDMIDIELQDYRSRNFLLPLNDYAKKAGILQELLEHPMASQFSHDGNIYALPRAKPYTFFLVYRKDAFRAVGLDPEKPPTTWDELLEYAERLTDPAEQRVGLVLPSMVKKGMLGAGGFLELVFALNGVEVIRRDGDGWIADFADDPRAVEAMNFIQQLIGRKITRGGKQLRGIAATSAGMVDDSIMFAQGPRAAMVIQVLEDLPWHVARGISPKHIGLALLPLGPSGQKSGGYVPVSSRFRGVNATCPTENRQLAAWQWSRFHMGNQLNRNIAKAYIDWGWAPFIDPEDVKDDPQLAGFAEEVPPQFTEVYKHMFDRVKALPMCPQHRRLRSDYLGRPIQALQENPDADAEQLLQEIQDVINREVFTSLPPEVQQKRRSIALAVVIAIGLVTLAGLYFTIVSLSKMMAADKDRGTVFQAGRRNIYILATFMMIPAVGSVILWAYLPLARGVMIAFQDYKIVGEPAWVGLDNFITVLTDPKFWISLWRTIQYGVLSLSLGFVTPIVLAFFLAEVPRFKITFRVLFYLPALTSGLIIVFLWKWMYDPTTLGLFNTLLRQAGEIFGMELGPYKWLDSHNLAMISVILPSVWGGVGPGCIIYLAALHGIPEELYEAADLDGAGIWHKAWNVAIPFMKPLIIINFLGAFIGTFHTMQNIFVMTGGGPGDSTYVVGLYIFFNSFVWLEFGKATAAAWILGSLLIGFTIYQLRILRDLKFQAGGQSSEDN